MPIVWRMSDGSVQLTTLAEEYLARESLPGETKDETVLRLALREQAKIPQLAGRTPVLVKTSDLPATRAKRAGWRLNSTVVVEDDGAYQAAQTAERSRVFDDAKLLKAVAVWMAQKLGVPLATAKAEILAIYKTL